MWANLTAPRGETATPLAPTAASGHRWLAPIAFRRFQSFDWHISADQRTERGESAVGGLTAPAADAIVNRGDPVRDRSATDNRTVELRFSDVRPWTLGDISVLVNGDERIDSPVVTGTAGPVENGSARFTLALEERVTNLTSSRA
ncbi:hypothetical protein I7X12_00310 [Halosimplex litoreum]|uniref:Uncharacterized protein n=1 Tax=Halosimplex litoreum TaxID=1198301 RepID=A0A7T3FYK0_9EURY|nr:hypothetical protein [Halosimplex litoreum]QPV63111.1 hypothetical protein I7X12_00310 [Halosimplex litoreum]